MATARLGTLALLAVCVAGCDLAAFAAGPRVNAGLPTASSTVVALAGADLIVLEGARVMLDGGATRAVDGTPTLAWTQRAGPPTALSNPSSPSPTFTAPLGPARLVFSLAASVGSERDEDEVVVDVVSHAPRVRPRLQPSPPDVAIVDDGEIVLRFGWQGLGAPSVRPRCALRDTTVLDGDDIVEVRVHPAELPCAVVVDDDGDGDGARANRIAVVAWPRGTPLVPASAAVLPAIVDPGDRVRITVPPGSRVDVADGAELAMTREETGVELRVTRRPTTHFLRVEQRDGAVSGGGLPVSFTVSAGNDNRAPVVKDLVDLRVRPGARFRIPVEAADSDGDALAITRTQVLGSPTRAIADLDDVRVAPEDTGPLLFHVSGDDGVCESAPVAVRVEVDPTAENRPPTLVLPARLHVTPGARFVLDARSARDDDSGLIDSWQIAQAPDDATVLLPTAADTPLVELVAPSIETELHFLLSAYDDEGLGVTAAVTVVVERAGPFVDPVRGDDTSGDGSALAPFATVSAAIDTAVRHRFPLLLLTAGTHPPFDGALPDGLGLQGGSTFDGAAYVDDDGATPTVLPVGPAGLRVTDATVRRLRLTGAGVVANRVVELADIDIDIDIDSAVTASPGAQLTLTASTLRGVLQGDDADIRLVDVLALEGLIVQACTLEVRGGQLGGAVGVQAEGGTVVLEGTRVATTSRGIALDGVTARLGGVVEVTSAGAGDEAIGVEVSGGNVDLARIEVVVDAIGDAAAVVVADATVGGTLVGRVRGARSTGVRAAAVRLEQSTVVVDGVEATGIVADAVTLARTRVTATASGAGVARALRADRGRVEASVLRASGGSDAIAVDASTAVGPLVLRHVTLRAGHTGLAAPPAAPGGPAEQSGIVVDVGNSVVEAPHLLVGVAGLGVVGIVGIVGIVGTEAVDGATCPRCVFAPPGALTDDDHLASDDALGLPHPFVDAGSLGEGVVVDIDGEPGAAGDAPDLGADERSAP